MENHKPTIFSKKNIRRSLKVILNGFNSLTGLVNNITLSYLVITFISINLWGSIVYLFMILDFAFTVISWGNKFYLMQEFSLSPRSINSLWRTSFVSRIPFLLILIILLFFLNYPIELTIYLTVWVVARYLYQSFDALIAFNRHFTFSLSLELSGLLIIAAFILFSETNISLTTFVSIYAMIFVFKAIITTLWFRKVIIEYSTPLNQKKWWRNKTDYLFFSFPFLLLAFSGMLQSKTDLYSVAYFLKKEDAAQYQIYMGLLNFSQLIASMLLSPFTQNIFRLNNYSFRKLERLFFYCGIVISFALIVFLYLLMRYVYHFEFSFYMYLLGYVYILLFYLYSTKYYELGKARKQRTAALLCLAGGLVNFLCSIFLTPQIGIEGALLSGVLSQLFMVVLFQNSDWFNFEGNLFAH